MTPPVGPAPKPAPRPTAQKAPAGGIEGAGETAPLRPAPEKPASVAGVDITTQANKAIQETAFFVEKDVASIMSGGGTSAPFAEITKGATLLKKLAEGNISLDELKHPPVHLDTSGPPKEPPEKQVSAEHLEPSPKRLRTAAEIAVAGESPVKRPFQETSAEQVAADAELGQPTNHIEVDIPAAEAELAQQAPPAEQPPAAEQPAPPQPEAQRGMTEQDQALVHLAYGKKAVDILVRLTGKPWDLRKISAEVLLKGSKGGLMHFIEATIVANADLTPSSMGNEYVLGVLEKIPNPDARTTELIAKLRVDLGDHHPLTERAVREGWVNEKDGAILNDPATPEPARVQIINDAIQTALNHSNFKAMGTILGELTGKALGSVPVQGHDGTYIIPDVHGMIAHIPTTPEQNPEVMAKNLQKLLYEAKQVGLLDEAKGMVGKSIMSLLALLAALSMSMQMVQGQEAQH